MTNMPSLPERERTILPPTQGTSPVSHQWTPNFIPENWLYMDGSNLQDRPRLGVVVVHIPIRTTIYIYATGAKEIRTIMRVDLLAIHTALIRFASHEWIGMFIFSLSSLQAIRHLNTNNPGTSSSLHDHNRMLFLGSITDLDDARRTSGFRTTPHTIRTHTNIRGIDLANSAAKQAVIAFDTLPMT
jgi:hypothetical protein